MAIVTEIVDPQCQALNLSDTLRCTAQATTNNGLFCRFHAKQCFGLYLGYKRRNAALDSLADRQPERLRVAKVPLGLQTFEDVEQESELQELHGYLLDQYVLLGKVISARKLHHKHFYPGSGLRTQGLPRQAGHPAARCAQSLLRASRSEQRLCSTRRRSGSAGCGGRSSAKKSIVRRSKEVEARGCHVPPPLARD